MRFTLIAALFVYGGTCFAGLSYLNRPDLFTPFDRVEQDDPLKDVAEEIRIKIDPTAETNWKQNYKPDFVEYMLEVHDSYKEFWKRIPASARLYVDLDNDGIKEYFVVSNGLNTTAWGFDHFFTILKRKMKNYEPLDEWEILFFHKFDVAPYASCDGTSGGKFQGFELVVTDLDRDNRPDILFTTSQIGGSAGSQTLHLLSMHPDMKVRYHQLWSRDKIEILNQNAIRPIMVQYADDEWTEDDCGASVRARGYRKAYFHWTVKKGFYEF